MRSAVVAGRTPGPATDPQAGMVTAELAMAIPSLALVVVLLTSVVGAASDLAKASDAARSGARAASVGVSDVQVVADASRMAPDGADVRVSTEQGWVHVSVRVPPLRWGPVAIPLPEVAGMAPLESEIVAVRGGTG